MKTYKVRNGNSEVELSKVDEPQDEMASQPVPEQYCTVYNDLMAIVNTMQGAEVKLLNFICLHLTVSGKGIIYLSTAFKEQAANATGYKERSINRAKKGLLKLGVILALPDSNRSKKYQINPLYLWKGDQDGRVAAIKMLGLTPTATPTLKGPKAKRTRMSNVKIDFGASIKERKGVIRDLLKTIQRENDYPDFVCKKFYDFYTRNAGKTDDGHKVMEFESRELRDNKPFDWKFMLKRWKETERPTKESKAEEQDRQLRERKPTIPYKDLF